MDDLVICYHNLLAKTLIFSNDIDNDLDNYIDDYVSLEMLLLSVNQVLSRTMNNSIIDKKGKENILKISQYSINLGVSKEVVDYTISIMNSYSFKGNKDIYVNHYMNVKKIDKVDNINDEFNYDLCVMKSLLVSDDEFKNSYAEKFINNRNFLESINYLNRCDSNLFDHEDVCKKIYYVIDKNISLNKKNRKNKEFNNYNTEILNKMIDRTEYTDYIAEKFLDSIIYSNNIENILEMNKEILNQGFVADIKNYLEENKILFTKSVKNNLYSFASFYRQKYKGNNEVWNELNDLVIYINSKDEPSLRNELKFLKKEYCRRAYIFGRHEVKCDIEILRMLVNDLIEYDFYVLQFLFIANNENISDFIKEFTGNNYFFMSINVILNEIPDLLKKEQYLRIKQVLNDNERLFLCNNIPDDMVITDELNKANKILLKLIKNKDKE